MNTDVKMLYKTKSSEDWQGFHPENNPRLNLPIQIFRTVPDANPEIINAPALPEDFIDGIEKKNFWKKVLTAPSLKWWKDYIEDPLIGSDPIPDFSFESLGLYVPPVVEREQEAPLNSIQISAVRINLFLLQLMFLFRENKPISPQQDTIQGLPLSL